MSMFYGYKTLGIFQSQEQVDEYNAGALDAWRAQNPGHTSFDPVTGQPLNGDGQPIGIYYQKMQTGVGDLIFDDYGTGKGYRDLPPVYRESLAQNDVRDEY